MIANAKLPRLREFGFCLEDATGWNRAEFGLLPDLILPEESACENAISNLFVPPSEPEPRSGLGKSLGWRNW